MIHIDTHPSGKATSLHTYSAEIDAFLKSENLTAKEKQEFLDNFYLDFATLGISERIPGEPYFVMFVMHGEAAKIPDPFLYYSKYHGNQNVKVESLGNAKEVQTMSLKEYFRLCRDNYNSSSGVCQVGPMRAASLVNKMGEEVFFDNAKYIKKLEQIPILKHLLPWGSMSIHSESNYKQSNDGPIMWVRPGEQIHGSTKDTTVQQLKKQRLLVGGEGNRWGSNERIKKTTRERIIEDWTPSHADHVEEVHLRQIAHAVGILFHTDFCKR